MDVVTAFADLRELGRFHAILFGWPACDRVEADVSGFLALENPCVRAVFPLDELGASSLYLAGMCFSNRSGGSTR